MRSSGNPIDLKYSRSTSARCSDRFWLLLLVSVESV
ncbi:Uncharacterised protein [Vibrio cholerae]|nr:Uncharacterised protein [Vibrio cholerae]